MVDWSRERRSIFAVTSLAAAVIAHMAARGLTSRGHSEGGGGSAWA